MVCIRSTAAANFLIFLLLGVTTSHVSVLMLKPSLCHADEMTSLLGDVGHLLALLRVQSLLCGCATTVVSRISLVLAAAL